MERVFFCWSGGKDSALALYEIIQSQTYEVVSLLSTVTEDYDRVRMHGVPRVLLERQADCLGLPLEVVHIPKNCSTEEYGVRMQETLTRFKQDGVSLVVFGDVFLEDVREYRENNLARIEMRAVFPLWGRDTAELAQSFVTLGFEAIITCIDSRVLDNRFIGRTIDDLLLSELPPGVDPCGENGEFHSFVLNGPIFKERVACALGEVVLRDSFYFCDLAQKETAITK
ncbi:MAG: diphthine--ammonia ligase [Dehalococcoidales bacterium]|nr:MAG: diphthine--ammonia ligase [Dehalococcoidales bacterium]